MKKRLKNYFLMVLFLFILIPNLVEAKEISKITLSGINEPVVGEVAPYRENIVISTSTEGVSVDFAQWQTYNSLGFGGSEFQEGTKYGLFIQLLLLEGDTLAEDISVIGAGNFIEESHYNDWIMLVYKTPGVGLQHTITFDTGGGSKIDSQLVYDGDAAFRPATPYREGYRFEGWFADNTFNEEFYFEGTNITKDVTVYAKWTLEAAIKQINSIKILGVEAPLAGQEASTTAYVDTEGLTTNDTQWETTDSYVYSGKFELGKKYCLYVGYDTKDYYEVNMNATVSANIEPDSYQILSGGVDLCYTVKDEVKVPFEIKPTSIKTNSIKLSWNKVDGAKGYIVYSSNNNKKWKKVTTIKKNNTLTYTVKKLKAGTKYYFKVVAYKVVKKKNKTIDTTKVLKLVTVPSTSKLKISSTYNKVKLSVGKVKGATKYIIERSTDKKNYVPCDTLTASVTFIDESIITGTKYYYRVKACNENCGKYSKVVNTKPSLKKPKLKLTSGKKKATIKINGVSGSEGYIVEKSTKKNKGFSVLITTTTDKDSFEDIGLKSKKKYYYRVRAYRIIDGKTIFSSYSKVVSVKTK